MAVQHQRRTQTAEYWLDEFAVHKEDLDYLYESILEAGEPRTIADLTQAIVERRVQREEEALSKQSDQGLVYLPQDRYEVGQRLVFPAFDYTTGQVLGVRAGNNPRYDPFSVIQVQLEGEEGPREFAAEFSPDHVLKRSAVTLEGGGDLLGAPQLYQSYGHGVRHRLEQALLEHDEFVHIGDRWFLRGLLPEVTPFQLNIAEALIDERGQPLTAAELLDEVELPGDSSLSARLLAVSYALGQDPRFVETTVSGETAWYLSDLIPPAVRRKPARLTPAHAARGGEWLSRELLDLVVAIGDEADELADAPASPAGNSDAVQILLTYPHHREGTLPLTSRVLRLLQEQPDERFMVTFVDRRNKEEIAGWMLPSSGYAWGLAEWYQRHEVPIGGVVELRRGEEPLTFFITCDEGKRKSEWVREARVLNGRLIFSMQRKAYTCRCDKDLLIENGSPVELDALWGQNEASKSLFEHLNELFPELAKLSGRGLVHAKTLYSAVNLTRRSGAVPIFAELTRRACFDPVGDGNWVYDESVRDVVYSTPEDMSRRPSSHRQDLIVDRVFAYGTNSEVKRT